MKKYTRGQSILEIIIAVAIFAILAGSVIVGSLGSSSGMLAGSNRAEAEAIALEGVEAVRSIRDGAFNELGLSQSGVATSSGAWIFDGEGTRDILGRFIRTITINQVCRDGDAEIVECPGFYEDIHSKSVSSNVEWEVRPGETTNYETNSYITNWDSFDWSQTDWSGGSGQGVWLDPIRYDSGLEVDVGEVGEVRLATDRGRCVGRSWNFDTESHYTYDPAKIEVLGGYAGLNEIITEVEGSDGELSSSEIYSFTDSTAEQKRSMITVSSGVVAIAYADRVAGVGTISIKTFRVREGSPNILIEHQVLRGDSSLSRDVGIYHALDDMYVVNYVGGSGGNAYMLSVRIDSSGTISDELGSFRYSTVADLGFFGFDRVENNIYAFTYSDSSTAHSLKTISINPTTGSFGTIINSRALSTNRRPKYLSKRSDNGTQNVFVIILNSSSSAGNKLYLDTINISDSGTISSSYIHNYTHSPPINEVGEISAMHIGDGDYYGVFYNYDGTNKERGAIATFGVNSTGTIRSGDEVIFPQCPSAAQPSRYLSMARVKDDVFIFVYDTVRSVCGGPTGVTERMYPIDGDTGDIGSLMEEVGIVMGGFASRDTDVTCSLNSVCSLSYLRPASYPRNMEGVLGNIGMVGQMGYPEDLPPINPATSYQPPIVNSWSSFTETAIKDGGEIYYQLSNDDGLTWEYWDGTRWAVASSDPLLRQFNRANIVNTNIRHFNPLGGQFKFRAYLESDGEQFVRLDTVSAGCETARIRVDRMNIRTDETTNFVYDDSYENPVLFVTMSEGGATNPYYTFARRVPALMKFEIGMQNAATSTSLSPPPRISRDVGVLLIEEGMWFVDGKKFEAGVITTTQTGHDSDYVGNCASQTFEHDFSGNVAVFHQGQDINPTSDRVHLTTFAGGIGDITNPPDSSGVCLGWNGSEMEEYDRHGLPIDEIGWLAVESPVEGSINIEGTTYNFETGVVGGAPLGHGDGCFTSTYRTNFISTPVTMVGEQSIDPTGRDDNGWAIVCSNDADNLGVHTEEDIIGDIERSVSGASDHAYIAFSNSLDAVIGGFAPLGELVSSAFNLGDASPVQIIEWDEVIPPCDPVCDIKLQIQTALDAGGTPGVWGTWSGPEGEDGDDTDYFTNPAGQFINTDHNGSWWVRYKATLSGDTVETPILEEVKINYK